MGRDASYSEELLKRHFIILIADKSCRIMAAEIREDGGIEESLPV